MNEQGALWFDPPEPRRTEPVRVPVKDMAIYRICLWVDTAPMSLEHPFFFTKSSCGDTESYRDKH